MDNELNMFLINAFLFIIVIIAFVRFLFFHGYIGWMFLVVIAWVAILISIEKARKRYHERLYVMKGKKKS